MAIVNRIRRLFHADVHAVLDIIEEPEAILKQAIRESSSQESGPAGRPTSGILPCC